MVPQTPTTLRNTYRETLDLMIEARNYLAYTHTSERSAVDHDARLKMSCEAFRVTSRLAHVMAWVMAQRAVQNGELAVDEACATFGLAAEDVCFDDSLRDDEELPDGLRSLMDRSYRLYVRVSRLDDQVKRRLH